MHIFNLFSACTDVSLQSNSFLIETEKSGKRRRKKENRNEIGNQNSNQSWNFRFSIACCGTFQLARAVYTAFPHFTRHFPPCGQRQKKNTSLENYRKSSTKVKAAAFRILFLHCLSLSLFPSLSVSFFV